MGGKGYLNEIFYIFKMKKINGNLRMERLLHLLTLIVE